MDSTAVPLLVLSTLAAFEVRRPIGRMRRHWRREQVYASLERRAKLQVLAVLDGRVCYRDVVWCRISAEGTMVTTRERRTRRRT